MYEVKMLTDHGVTLRTMLVLTGCHILVCTVATESNMLFLVNVVATYILKAYMIHTYTLLLLSCNTI